MNHKKKKKIIIYPVTQLLLHQQGRRHTFTQHLLNSHKYQTASEIKLKIHAPVKLYSNCYSSSGQFHQEDMCTSSPTPVCYVTLTESSIKNSLEKVHCHCSQNNLCIKANYSELNTMEYRRCAYRSALINCFSCIQCNEMQ